ncbi:MAG: hypothetical protein KDA80_17080, partial [Planctomycetaceae bacterium]|nr:hypothetical protein [Planctomycetaceae bacterium]
MRRNFTRTCPPLRVPSGLVYGLKFACAFLMLVGFLPRPAVSQEEESSLPAVVIEEALYKATVHHDELIQGELTLILSHRVPGAAIVDWTDVEIPVHDLTWVGKTPSEASPVVWGTAPDGRVLVVIPSEARRLTGRWSLRGTPFGEKTHFPMRLPEALRTSLQILTESSERVSVGNGWVRLKASESLSGMSEWEIELGRNRETLLSVGPPTPIQPSATWRYSDDSLYIAQRDGFLIQCDFLVEPLDRGETASPLVLRLPGSFEPQSLTLAGIPVSWETVPGSRRDIKIPLQAGDLMSRTKLRLRGFQQTSWGRRRTLPRILMQNGRLIERFLSLRVEPPLQVHALQSDKMIQTELAADESGGEFWRFQATRPDGVLAVEINQPRAEMNARIDSLLDLRTTGYWSATVVTIEVEKGTAFESRLVLPKGWEPVSLQEVGTDSRVAAWAFQEGTLSIHWQNPATRSTPRQALLLSYIPSISMDRGVEFQVPFAREVKSQQSQLSLVLNPDQRLEIQEGQSWNPVDSVEIPAVIRRDSDIAQKLGQLSQSKLLAFSQQSRSAPLPLQFETRKESESASATSELEPVLVSNPDMPNGGDTPTDETAPAAACELTTSIGLAETQSLVHHAQYHFDAPWNPGLGEIRLPATVRLSSVSVDGLAVSVLRDGDLLRFPQDLKSARVVELTYVTDRTPGIWGTHHIVPIPILASSRHGVQWSLRLPDELQLGEISLPGRVTERIPPPNSIVSWLGPLGRPPDKSIFLPFSASHWRRLFEGGNDGFSGSSHREYLMIFPNVGDTIQFSTWDAGRTAGLSWVAMIACLMIGTGSRLFRVAWIVQLTAVWLAMLMVAASLLPPALAVICGAMVLGSLLSVLIPRRVIERPDFLDWSSTVRRRSRTIAGAVCLLIVMNPELLRSQPTESSAGDFQPTSLIRSATYDLVWGNPGAPPSVRATIDALLPKGTPSPLLKLPFNNVVFPATTECLANGSRVPLIPSVNADALLVDLSSILSEADTEDAGSVWWPITLEMEFLAKPIGQRGNEQPEFAFIDAIVPKVLDSELE